MKNNLKNYKNKNMSYDIISTRKRKTMKIVKPIDIYNAIKRYGKKKQEYFIVITLNSVKDIIAIHIATIGLVNQTIIHAREIFKHVFLDNAVGLIVAHNHPSKAIQPSNDDIEITKHISKVSKIMGIHFLDHLIINQKSYYSFRQNGKML